MVTIAAGDTFTQVVRFDVRPDQQEKLIAAIAGEVERWIRQRPGFISSSFHASLNGQHVLNYAQWRDEKAFKQFTQDPEGDTLSAVIHAIDPRLRPHTMQYRVVRSIGRPA
jgi:quinol monooxygenase YgiN